MRERGLIVLTSVERLPGGRSAGFWLPEAAYPWLALVTAGWDYAFASTRAGTPPMGGVDRSDPPQRMFLEDGLVRERLASTVTPGLLDPADFGVVFVAGGHGAILDLPEDEQLARFLGKFTESGGVLAAVCHGVGALLGVAAPDGRPLVEGRRVTAFTQAEERAVGLDGVVPYFLDEALEQRGARYLAGEPFRSHVVVDGRLITGQNPASAVAVAAQAMELVTGRPLPEGWSRRAPAVHPLAQTRT
ncbi:type 1 glutamine amidotransferase domain-containing protein [Streptomyces showdoensis]|uniref:type 1 glutamine amidotransferase domain-containing protein n=1 Tax=Streptomyces showdoensis TaxID=68268 RepID=UPI00196A0AE6|nr:type 1 glutamine amidotransferase domain-containing protein [Streptomyces showdoensis]